MSHLREKNLDALRGVAASIVVFVHYFAAFFPCTVFGNQGSYQKQAEWEGLFLYPPFGFFIAGHFAICLFFILSGYVLSYKFWGESQYKSRIFASIVKRPVRLGGLVLFTEIVGALLWDNGLLFNDTVSVITTSQPWFHNFWKGDFKIGHFFVASITSMFKLSNPYNKYNPPLWTISIELYGSILVLAFVFLFGNFKYRLALLTGLLLLFKASLYQGFLIGMIMADVSRGNTLDHFPKLNRYLAILLLMLSIYFASYPHYVDSETLSKSMYGFLPRLTWLGGDYSMLGALLLFVSVTRSTRIKGLLASGVFQFLGKISYSLYGIHFLMLGSVSSWLFLSVYKQNYYTLSFISVLAVSFLVMIPLSYLLTVCIDKPAILFASRVGKYTDNLVKMWSDKEFFRKIVSLAALGKDR